MEQLQLAAPANPSTFFQERVKVIGVHQITTKPNGAYFLKVAHEEFPILQPSITSRGEDYLIEFDHDFTKFIPIKITERKNYSICLVYRNQNLELTSPSSTITFHERAVWNQALGGYVYPELEKLQITSRFFVVEGWAAKVGCKQEEVSVKIGRKKFWCPNLNVWSPNVGRSLPSIEQAMCSHFSVVIEKSELPFGFWHQRSLSTEIKFTDGSFLELPKVKFSWGKPQSQTEIKPRLNQNVLFIANNLRATEGAPRVLYQVIKLTLSLGHKVGVISPIGGELETDLRELGAIVNIIPDLYLAHYSRIENFTKQTKKAKQLLEEFNPNLVFGNTIEAFWGISHAQSLGLKTHWLIHESVNPKKVFEELDPRARVLFLEALDSSNNIFVSNATKKLFSSYGKTSKVIPNGVAPLTVSAEQRKELRFKVRQKFSIPDECPLVLSVGTISRRKGQDMLIAALAKINDLDFRAILVGGRESDFLEQIKSQISSLGLNDKVFIKDETKDVEQFYAAADLFAISSREESAPLVSLEALNWSLPVVSTDAFGLEEQLKESGAALLSPVEEVSLFAEHLRKMIEDPALRDRSGKNGKCWVEERFNLDSSLELYRQILEHGIKVPERN